MNSLMSSREALIEQLKSLLLMAPIILMALSFHEFSHGFVSDRLGDPTPRREGRLSLNPLRHLDPKGLLCLLIFHFGWAKPVMVNPSYYKKPRRDLALVALAGPMMNFLLAFLSLLFYGIVIKNGWGEGTVGGYIEMFLYYSAYLNVNLGIFNLIPIPPLDGSNILKSIVPRINTVYQQIGRYSALILIVCMVSGVLGRVLGRVDSFIMNGMWQLIVRCLV